MTDAPAVSPTAPVGEDRILLGLNTFGDVGENPDGSPQPHAQVLRQLLEQAELADAVGLHAFGVGEHHRKDYAVSPRRSSWPPRRRARPASGWARQ